MLGAEPDVGVGGEVKDHVRARMAPVSAGGSSVSPRTSVNAAFAPTHVEESLLAGREVVERDDRMAVDEKSIDQMCCR